MMNKCYKCLFHMEDNDMGATHDCCLLKDNIAERVEACYNSENCKKQLTLEEAKRYVDSREEEVTDENRDKQIEEKTKTTRQTHFRLYKVWDNMKARCYNPKHKSYYGYGGRGITICEEWKNNFNSFAKWALENGYTENAPKGKCTIDRIDNNKGYSPDNCKWVSIGENLNNKRNCRMFTHNGKTQSLADWARDFGMDYNAFLSRMYRNGYDFEQAILPRKNKSRHIDIAELKRNTV